MTQALLNNLNTYQDKTINLTEKMSNKQGMDFGKIFDSKTTKTQPLSNNTQQETSSDSINTLNIDSTTQDANCLNNSISNNDTSENTTINTSEDNTIVTASSSDNSDTNALIDIETIQNNEIITIEKNTQDIIEELITIEENTQDIIEELITIEDTTTANEEPTIMYNELNTLEDSASLLLLQTQIQKTVLNNDEQENEPVNTNLLKTANQNIQDKNNSTAIFKQFDNNIEKDLTSQAVQNSIFKETKQSKNDYQKPSNIISENIVKELDVEVINSQTSESSMGDLMQNQTPQEQAARVMIQGDIKFDEIVQETAKNPTQIKATEITPSKIIEQISKQLDGMINNSKLNMVLNPGSLGKINLQILNSKEGLMAQFTVTTQEAKDILLKGLDGLKESLLAQGVNVDNVSVKLEDTDGEYNLDYTEQEGSRGGNKQQGTKKQKENEKQFEQMMFELENEVNV